MNIYQYTTITAEEQHIIKHTKKTTLYHNCTPWRKKTSNFDVTMGSYDGAETCELVGLFLLSQLKEIDANVGLYRDDGLAACRLTPRQAENTKKRICQVFQNYGLKITIEANKKIVNFLDVTLDLRNDSYKPYKKPNDNVSYIHKCSNHPPVVIKNLPKSIMKRINTNSQNKEIFNHAAPIYTEALKRSGFNQNFKFNKDKEENNKNKEDRKKRSRKIT
ncbi:inositol hexakisphosphate and diphosphoinositol-pentakisphosphate kinase 2 [Elysia marginata]|uniref:Inositol hexakisphosphate and diphosphoinositol-pentakisphosphate kinase 2 n=1 Tax=Elysia marginata TaxID=1093978 RepID=A0AAV4EF33_9GAST|nr:inositol hexakisphosphate and diphosphoinositol-pentakisphosphate kinase 2 [Elysia marginata]